MSSIDISITGSLADALKGHPSATPLAISLDGFLAVRASYEVVGGGVVLALHSSEAPSVEATVVALNAELVTSAPEVKVAKSRK